LIEVQTESANGQADELADEWVNLLIGLWVNWPVVGRLIDGSIGRLIHVPADVLADVWLGYGFNSNSCSPNDANG
jgi:hypothetical protein